MPCCPAVMYAGPTINDLAIDVLAKVYQLKRQFEFQLAVSYLILLLQPTHRRLRLSTLSCHCQIATDPGCLATLLRTTKLCKQLHLNADYLADLLILEATAPVCSLSSQAQAHLAQASQPAQQLQIQLQA